MIQNGPLIHFWGMKFEQKHGDHKYVAFNTSSNKNLHLTIGIRNQLRLCHRKEFTNELKTDVLLRSVKCKNVISDVKKL